MVQDLISGDMTIDYYSLLPTHLSFYRGLPAPIGLDGPE